MGPHAASEAHGTAFAAFPFVEDFDDEPPSETTLQATADAAGECGLDGDVAEPAIPAMDVVALRAEAYAEGRRDGRAAVEAEREEAARLTLATIAARLGPATTEAVAAADAAAAETAKLLLHILSSMMPALCRRHGAGDVIALVRAVVPALAHEPHIAIRVSPHVRAEVEAELEAIAQARGAPEHVPGVRVIATDAMAPGDARISWGNGSAVRSVAELWNAVIAKLAPLGLFDELQSPPAPPGAGLNPKVPEHV